VSQDPSAAGGLTAASGGPREDPVADVLRAGLIDLAEDSPLYLDTVQLRDAVLARASARRTSRTSIALATAAVPLAALAGYAVGGLPPGQPAGTDGTTVAGSPGSTTNGGKPASGQSGSGSVTASTSARASAHGMPTSGGTAAPQRSGGGSRTLPRGGTLSSSA